MVLSEKVVTVSMVITEEMEEKASCLSSFTIGGEVERKKVFLDAIAAYILNDYLYSMKDGLNLVSCLSEDIEDVQIPFVPGIECCLFKENEDFYLLPFWAWENRVAYVGIEIKLKEKKAVILGFSPTHKNGILFRRKLCSYDDISDLLLKCF